MTQEDKDLLLKDLSARLPYGVIIETCDGNGHLNSIDQTIFGVELGVNVCPVNRKNYSLEDCKPYLFPLSSMTKEQKKEYSSLVWFDGLSNGWNRDDAVILNEVEMLIDFYNKNHLDWRGLIPKGLAKDATGLNIY